MNHLSLGKHHHRIHALTLTLTMTAVLLAASSGLSPRSYAASYSHNPLGVVNYCTLSGGITVIHGWAHDPDASAGSYPKVAVKVGTVTNTVKTSITGYQDTAINKYITSKGSSIPHSSKYGFTASFSGLYKGSSYAVSATALNYGSGSNTNLLVDSASKSYDAIKVANLLTAPNILPQTCLATKPAAPLPPAPEPEPDTASDTSSDDSFSDYSDDNSSDSGNDDASADTSSDDTAPADVAGKADATLAVGTSSANVSAPADGAQSIYVLYGLSAANLDGNTDDVTVTGDKAIINLTGLRSKTTYYYQIVRTTADEQISTSPTASFKTTGYSIILHLIDVRKKPVSNIPGVLSDKGKTAVKSDKNGNLNFADLDSGVYTVKYQYNNHTYTKEFDTDTAASDALDNSGKVAVLSDTINVSTLTDTPAKKHSSAGTIVILLFFIIVIGGAIVWLLLRRRNFHTNNQYSHYGAPTPAVVSAPQPNLPPAPLPVRKISKNQAALPPDPQLDHVGESLREMVVRSMHEEAQKRRQGQ